MCGRYYVDDDTAKEIEKIIQQVDEKLKKETGSSISLQTQDIHPTDTALVLAVSGHKIDCKRQRWGFPGVQGKQVIFNARSETVLEKKMFHDSVRRRRIVIPAAGFYEWNRNKEKNIFYRQDYSVLFMAGFYNSCQGEDRFVILTTAANKSMQLVHDRMPLILEPEEIEQWIFDDSETKKLLLKTPCLLERRAEYRQLSLWEENTIN